MNTVSLIGRLTSAPELRYTPSGKEVTDITLATDDPYDRESTFFFGITVWGKQAATLAQYAVKGQQIGITGRLTQEEFTPKGETQPVRKTRVVCERFDFLSKPRGADGPATTPPPAATAPRDQSTTDTDYIPF